VFVAVTVLVQPPALADAAHAHAASSASVAVIFFILAPSP
jgi:hypothetical protein